MGYFYQKLVEHVSLEHPPGDAIDLLSPQNVPSTPHSDLEDIERVPLLRKTATPADPNKAFAEMEMHLQISLIKVSQSISSWLACSARLIHRFMWNDAARDPPRTRQA